MQASSSVGRRRFRSAALEEMLAAAEAAYPQEWVGALLGDRGQIEKVVGLPNMDVNPLDGYYASPTDLLSVVVQNPGLELLGVAHSHPNGDSQLSPVDREHALPGLWYIVIPVISGRANRIGLWQL